MIDSGNSDSSKQNEGDRSLVSSNGSISKGKRKLLVLDVEMDEVSSGDSKKSRRLEGEEPEAMQEDKQIEVEDQAVSEGKIQETSKSKQEFRR